MGYSRNLIVLLMKDILCSDVKLCSDTEEGFSQYFVVILRMGIVVILKKDNKFVMIPKKDNYLVVILKNDILCSDTHAVGDVSRAFFNSLCHPEFVRCLEDPSLT